MRIKFNGIVEKKRRGCNCSQRTTSSGLVTSKSYILPSGTTKFFRRGKVETVLDSDGAFLLKYQYQDGGETKPAFTEVV